MVKKIKVGFFGDGPWALAALSELLSSERYSISFYVKRFNSIDVELENLLTQYDIPLLNLRDVNCESNTNLFMSYEPDIFVSMSFDQIMKERIINATKFGFVNCHAGLLPFYRGRNSLNWALINGEEVFGISVHLMDDGVDTGPIIVQEMLPISEDDDYSTLLDRAYKSCPKVLMRGLDAYIANPKNLTPQSQISDKHSYFPRRVEGDEWINWDLNSNQIHDFVRGITFPGPGARTIAAGKEIIVCKTKLYNFGAFNGGMSGQVVGQTDEGILVKCGRGIVTICSYADLSENGDPLRTGPANFKLGTFLGFKSNYEFNRLNKKNEELARKIEDLTKTIETIKNNFYRQ